MFTKSNLTINEQLEDATNRLNLVTEEGPDDLTMVGSLTATWKTGSVFQKVGCLSLKAQRDLVQKEKSISSCCWLHKRWRTRHRNMWPPRQRKCSICLLKNCAHNAILSISNILENRILAALISVTISWFRSRDEVFAEQSLNQKRRLQGLLKTMQTQAGVTGR